MRCAWDTYIHLLPAWMRTFVNEQGRNTLLELRLRLEQPPELVTTTGSLWMIQTVKKEDLIFCINTASRYSPWSATTISRGYITSQGGHRLGICGVTATTGDKTFGISSPTSVCLRVARDFPGIANGIPDAVGSLLIIGKPGSGKTTLLRDLIRRKSNHESGSICVVDEKSEVFPMVGDQFCFSPGKRTDVITGCSKQQGIEAVLRNMCPRFIAVDEITAAQDCQALLHAGWCGVRLLATAHAENSKDLVARPVYRPIIDSGIFEHLLILQEDKSWRLERMYA